MKNVSTLLQEAQQEVEFIMIKPGFIHLTPILLNIITNAGLRPIAWATKTLNYTEARKFYEPHKDEDFYEDLCTYMMSGPSTGIKCLNTNEGDVSKLKDSIREKYGEDEMRNVMHSSDSPKRRTIESNIYLKK